MALEGFNCHSLPDMTCTLMAEDWKALEGFKLSFTPRQELVWHGAVLLPNYTLMAEEVLRLEALEGFNCHSLPDQTRAGLACSVAPKLHLDG